MNTYEIRIYKTQLPNHLGSNYLNMNSKTSVCKFTMVNTQSGSITKISYKEKKRRIINLIMWLFKIYGKC